MRVQAIPILKDNYVWTIMDADNTSAIVVDPGEAEPVMHYLQQHQLNLAAILITHHHHDHCGGVKALLEYYQVPVYGKNISSDTGVTHAVFENFPLAIELGTQTIQFTLMEIPGHTLDHISYYSENNLFCGDTLFSAGCGRLFEGTPEQMYSSLMKITALPDDTNIYCAHEYTLSNLLFAQAVEPNNLKIKQHIAKVQELMANNISSIPSTLNQEKAINPFLRCTVTNVIAAAEQYANKKLTNEVEVFASLRQWKNVFKA
jgi:hydroxyacylglutathione hydrolase